MNVRRRVLSSVVLVAVGLTVSLFVLADKYASRYLSEREAWLQREISVEQSRAVGYRRIILNAPLDQNAAVWYRLAFSQIQLLPADTGTAVGAAVRAGSETDNVRQEVFRSNCREAVSPRVHTALRCTHCNWELKSGDDTGLWRDAMVLGNCLILSGHVSRDSETAIQSYLNALTFSADLAQADFMTDLIGIVIAKSSLEALATVIASRDCTAECLKDILEKLRAFTGRLPTVMRGLRLATLDLARDMQRESLAGFDRYSSRSILPWHAISAWRLSQEQPLLTILQRAAMSTDLSERSRLDAEIREQLARRHQARSNPALETWAAAMNDVDDVGRQFKAVETGIAIEQWRFKMGSYPSNADVHLSQLSEQGLEYAPSEDRSAYTITIAAGPRAGTVVVKAPSGK